MKATPKQVAAIEKYVAVVQSKIDAYWSDMKFVHGKPTAYVKFGSKFAKVCKKDSGQKFGSVHSFVEIASGDIYMAAGWAAPAKHVRGSIYAPDGGAGAIEWTGAKYLSNSGYEAEVKRLKSAGFAV